MATVMMAGARVETATALTRTMTKTAAVKTTMVRIPPTMTPPRSSGIPTLMSKNCRAGWQCRVLDQPVGGQDGFTMFTEGNELNITIGTPSPFGPACELLQMCDAVEPIALSDNFPDTTLLDIAGTVTIYGTHTSVDAELVITKVSALTPDELQLIRDVLDSVEPV